MDPNRRAFLIAGSRTLLGAGLGYPLLTPLASAQVANARSSAIVIYLAGGPSHLDTFDPKPEAPSEIRGEYGVATTSVAGVRISEKLPRLAGAFGRYALIRGVSHTLAEHDTAERFVLSGDRTGNVDSPAVGSVVVFKEGWRIPPPYVAIPELRAHAGLLGARCEPFHPLGDEGMLMRRSPTSGELKTLGHRAQLLEQLDKSLKPGQKDTAILNRDEAYRQSFEVVQSDGLRKAVDLSLETDATRDSYGRHTWGDYLLLARRMVEFGTRLVTVILPGWDTHVGQYRTLDRLLPQLDQALSALVEDLGQRGLLQKTVVVALGEFGRTPRLNPTQGRDHWPQAMSVFWAGGKSQGQRVVGETDRIGGEPRTSVYSPVDLVFTLFQEMGIEPEEIRLPPDGRKLLFKGRRILELFS